MMPSMTKDTILEKLEIIYQRAFNDNKWHIALQVAKLQAKYVDLFQKPPLPDVIPIKDMTEEQLIDLLDALERLNPELKHPPSAPQPSYL